MIDLSLMLDMSGKTILSQITQRFIFFSQGGALRANNTAVTVKHGVGSVMWRLCLIARGFGELYLIFGIINQN